MDDAKIQFVSRYLPPSIVFLDLPGATKGILKVDTQRDKEIIVLAIEPTEQQIKALKEQKHLPSTITFDVVPHTYIKNALGIQGKQNVVAMIVQTASYRTSPYIPWFASYPRAVALYVGIVGLLGTALYFSS